MVHRSQWMDAYEMLKKVRPIVSVNTYRTLKGQIKNGDTAAAIKGMERILEKRNANRTQTKILERKEV